MLVAEEKIVESTAAGVDKVAEHVEDSITFIGHLQDLAMEYLPSILLAIVVFVIGRYLAMFIRKIVLQVMNRANYIVCSIYAGVSNE